MKRFLLNIALLMSLLPGLGVQAMAADRQGHRLTALWKEYENIPGGRPETRKAVLSRISAQALRQRLPWDYYDAVSRYRDVTIGRNWKERESAEAALEKAVADYGDPVLVIFHKAERIYAPEMELSALVFDNRERLSAQRSDDLWAQSHTLPGLVRVQLESDWDYALWLLASRQSFKGRAVEELGALYGESYPKAAVLEYFKDIRAPYFSMDEKAREEALKSYKAKYEPRAAALIAEQDLLSLETDRLASDPGTASARFLELHSELKDFERRRAAFKGGEKKIASCLTDAAARIRQLEGREAYAWITDGELSVSLRNLAEAAVTVRKGRKAVFSKTLKNGTRSFYRPDTLTLMLPDFDDGLYEVDVRTAARDKSFPLQYDKATLSLASRWNGGVLEVYVADHKSGEPVGKADLVYEGPASGKVEGLVLDGFTPVPEPVYRLAGDRKPLELTFSFVDAAGRYRRSNTDHIYDGLVVKPAVNASEHNLSGIIYKSAAAFRPGDRMQFKAIIYEGDASKALRTAGEGLALTARLSNPKGEECGRLDLVTNEFGSVAGEFILPSDGNNGAYNLAILQGGRHLAGTVLQLEEYVLPTMEMDIEPLGGLYFPGDKIPVKGRVKSFTGHPVNTARLVYSVDSGPGTEIPIMDDGSFAVMFESDTASYYHGIRFTVTDVTGEVLSRVAQIRLQDVPGLSTEIGNTCEGSWEAIRKGGRYRPYGGASDRIVGDDIVPVVFGCRNTSGVAVSADVSYTVSKDGRQVSEGRALTGQETMLDLGGDDSGVYTVKATLTAYDQSGKKHETTSETTVLKVRDDATALDAEAENFMRILSGEGIRVQLGGSNGALWLVAELWGDGGQLLRKEIIRSGGQRGERGSVTTLEWDWKESYTPEVELRLFCFHDSKSFSLSHQYTRPVELNTLPLSFGRFLDMAAPAAEYTFSLATAAGVELLAAVWDKATDTIRSNRWNVVRLHPYKTFSPHVTSVCGSNSTYSGYYEYSLNDAAPVRSMGMKAARVGAVTADSAVMEESLEVPDDESVEAEGDAGGTRSEFAEVLAFEPFLRSGPDGLAEFSFRTSDKLSTYRVVALAHDKDMNNSLVEKEMTVTLPVKVALSAPQFLYEGDEYTIRASVTSIADRPVSGNLALEVYDGTDWTAVKPFAKSRKAVGVEAGGQASSELRLKKVPVMKNGTMGIRVVFSGRYPDGGAVSDGIFDVVPVLEPRQTIVEAHSALLPGDGSRKALTDSLMRAFVNGRKSDTMTGERKLYDMLLEVLDGLKDSSGDDLASLSGALEVRLLSTLLEGGRAETDVLSSRILALRNADGGFSWLSGMYSSPQMTALLLERLARLESVGLRPAEFSYNVIRTAVQYLDRSYFGDTPVWWRGISREQYFYVRSLYPSIPFEIKPDAKERREDREYLTPAPLRNEATILARARRARTLLNLLESEGGRTLASRWGVSLLNTASLRRTLRDDLASLREYAVAHPSGGCYFPNAVMPFRGLMESELYAHSFICDTFAMLGEDALADGLRTWIMLQKDTQDWRSDPAFVEAVFSVSQGSGKVMDSVVLTLSREIRSHVADIRPAGNEMSVERRYTVLKDGKWEPLSGGETLHVGQRVRAEYRLWSRENRSFVRLMVPRPACLTPVDKLSGGYWRYGYYRTLRSDRSEYYWDGFAEEKHNVTEEFDVTQEGRFVAPVPVIESLYAPHYRANGESVTLSASGGD